MTLEEKAFNHIDFILLDLLSLCVSFLVSFWGYFYLKYESLPSFDVNNGAYRVVAVLILLIHFFYAFSGDSYTDILHRNATEEIRSIIWHNIKLLGTILFVLFFLKESATYSRMVLAIFFFLNNLFMTLFRFPRKKHLLKVKRTSAGRNRHLLLVTEPEHADELKQLLAPKAYSGYDLIGTADDTSYLSVIKDNIVDEVLVSFADEAKRNKMIESLLDIGLTVHIDIGQFFEETPNSRMNNINDRSVITTSVNPMTFRQKFVKRIIDIIGAIFGLIFTVILFIIFAPIIFIQSPGHIIFKQKRVGKNGRIFNFYKFRSMYPDAEARKQALMDQNKMDGLMFKMDNDPRIIPIGRFLRKTSLDEFPQFWNVLKGDMSLVGTRPPTLDEYEKYTLYHASRLSIKPGITGLWQISGRSNITDFEEVVKLDCQYIRNFSLLEDLRIMVRTITVVFTQKGSA